MWLYEKRTVDYGGVCLGALIIWLVIMVPVGRLVANREVPVLKRAKDLLDVKE